MTPSKIKEAAAVRRRQNAILNAVEAAGTMTMAEINAHFEGTKRNISQGTVGYMIRIGLLEAVPTNARTKNGNIINTYVVGGKGADLKSEPHRRGVCARRGVGRIPQNPADPRRYAQQPDGEVTPRGGRYGCALTIEFSSGIQNLTTAPDGSPSAGMMGWACFRH